MECLFGITGKDFVLLAADKLVARSIVVMKSDELKLKRLNNQTVMAYAGESGDATNFAEYIQRNISLYTIRNDDRQLSPKAVATFVRNQLAESLRTRSPYNVNILIGGCDVNGGGSPQLFWIDYLGSMVQVPYGVHGYGSYFCTATLDRHWQPDMNLEQAVEVLKKCFAELKTRFIVNIKEYSVQVIRNTGSIETITF